MIIDKIENILFYKDIVPNLENGILALKELKNLEDKKHLFDGGYFMVQKGETKPMEEGTFEAHRKYIDVQVIVDGSEEMAWANICDLETVIDYDDAKDAERLNGDKSNNMLISKDMFYIAFPHDGHKPVSHTNKKQIYTKIVMKLLIN